MKPIKVRNAVEALESKGFLRANSHHKFWYFFYKGKKTSLYARISHSSSEMLQREMRGIARTLQLTSHRMEDLLRCPMSKTEFETHAKKVLPDLAKLDQQEQS